ncbi:hypothetical protein CDL15_Pgr012628 [Punica granatum]|uniref:Uncharacterized protein n=1 Tax=Punica granatum TaxID=22663 RepID=A0A218XZM0_PUNGR|nr:hypothetical protein CDL15_Pgr012628 [Punica granatum]PKI70210.1 hypothetical protein CRG98_009402 [Punica granatum]
MDLSLQPPEPQLKHSFPANLPPLPVGDGGYYWRHPQLDPLVGNYHAQGCPTASLYSYWPLYPLPVRYAYNGDPVAISYVLPPPLPLPLPQPLPLPLPQQQPMAKRKWKRFGRSAGKFIGELFRSLFPGLVMSCVASGDSADDDE